MKKIKFINKEKVKKYSGELLSFNIVIILLSITNKIDIDVFSIKYIFAVIVQVVIMLMLYMEARN